MIKIHKIKLHKHVENNLSTNICWLMNKFFFDKFIFYAHCGYDVRLHLNLCILSVFGYYFICTTDSVYYFHYCLSILVILHFFFTTNSQYFTTNYIVFSFFKQKLYRSMMQISAFLFCCLINRRFVMMQLKSNSCNWSTR